MFKEVACRCHNKLIELVDVFDILLETDQLLLTHKTLKLKLIQSSNNTIKFSSKSK